MIICISWRCLWILFVKIEIFTLFTLTCCCWTNFSLNNPLFGFLTISFRVHYFHLANLVLFFCAKDACVQISVVNMFTGGNSLCSHYHLIRLDSTIISFALCTECAIHLLKASSQRKYAFLCLEIWTKCSVPVCHTHVREYFSRKRFIYENIWKIQPHSRKGFSFLCL